MLRKQVISTNNPHVIHEVIITSPLGIVPRELEIVYPAASYDIPVTGIWEGYEKKMIKNLFQVIPVSSKIIMKGKPYCAAGWRSLPRSGLGSIWLS